jgi:dGTPase
VEGEIVSWSDRIAYCAHDLEDAVRAGIVRLDELPGEVAEVAGTALRDQLRVFIEAVVAATCQTGRVGMDAATAGALAGLRRFNYERIYTRPEALAQSRAVVEVLRALVGFYSENPSALPAEHADPDDPVRGAVGYVAGMTDRYAFDKAVRLLGYPAARLPQSLA